MARRMFSLQIVDSDAFLDMSVSAQALYFHLGMRADDDGFISNPRRILKSLNGSLDDYSLLLGKRFVLPFENGVAVIKHWRINNYIRKDRYHETVYSEEKNLLNVKGNGGYTLDRSQGSHISLVPWKSDESMANNKDKISGIPTGIPLVAKRSTEDRIGEERIHNTGAVRGDGESTKNIMYNYEAIDSEGNPLKKKLSRIDKETNEALISVGFLWQELAVKNLSLKKEDVVMLNLYYPIRKAYDREKLTREQFQSLFTHFFMDKNIKYEDKLSFDLCLSQKYMAKWKLAQRNRRETNVSISDAIIL